MITTMAPNDEADPFTVPSNPVSLRSRSRLPISCLQPTDLEQYLKPRSTRTPHTASILKRPATVPAPQFESQSEVKVSAASECAPPASESECSDPAEAATPPFRDNSTPDRLVSSVSEFATAQMEFSAPPIKSQSVSQASTESILASAPTQPPASGARDASLNAAKLMQDRAFDSLLRNLTRSSTIQLPTARTTRTLTCVTH